jgi:hypothetical protein
MSGRNTLGYPDSPPNTYTVSHGNDNQGICFSSPYSVATSTAGMSSSVNTVVVVNNSTFVSVNLSSSTAYSGVTAADNRTLASPSYTFVARSDQYTKILSAQCDRVSNHIFGQLEHVDRSDQDQNELIVDDIAEVIGLVGEPAAYAALFEAHLLKEDPTVLEPLLLAIGSAHHKESEADRVQALRQYANDADYRIRRAAVRALGRMNTAVARSVLRDISSHNQGSEIGRFAAAMLR